MWCQGPLGGSSLDRRTAPLHFYVIRIIRCIFRVEGISRYFLYLHRLSCQIQIINLYLDLVFSIQVQIYDRGVYIALIVLACHHRILLHSVIELLRIIER